MDEEYDEGFFARLEEISKLDSKCALYICKFVGNLWLGTVFRFYFLLRPLD